MKVLSTFFILPVVWAVSGHLAGSVLADPDVDVTAYTIAALIEGERITETVTLHAESRSPVRELTLDLAPTMEVQSCKVDGKDVPFDHTGWEIELDLGNAGAPRGAFSIVFEVKGKPYMKFSESRGGFVRTNIAPEHAYIRSQYSWYPRRADDPALYDTSITLRKDWRVRTAGKLVEKREEEEQAVWRFKLDKPDRRIGLAAADYLEVEQKTESGSTIDALVFPGHEEGGKALLETAARALDFYVGLFGAVPEERFTLVEMPAPFGPGSGYGETGYTLIGTGAFERAGEASWAESLVAHEVSHTWWGHEVGFLHFASESFATYATHRYLEKMQGKEAACAERGRFVKRILAAAKQEEVPLEDIKNWGGDMDPMVYTAHAYDKGAMILHILDCELGRETFDEALKNFFEKYRGQVIDYPTVCKDLCASKGRWAFNQWGNPGIPDIWEEHEVRRSGSSYSVKGTLFQEGTDKPFRMSVCLRATAGENKHDETVELKRNKASFRFSCPFEPEEIIIDPDCHLILRKPGAEDVQDLITSAFGVANNPREYDEHKLQQAIKDFEKIIKAGGGKKSEYIAGIGRCLFRLGELDQAREKLEEAIDMGDSGNFWEAWIYLRLANIADLQNKRSQAKKYYKKVLDLSKADIIKYQQDLAAKYMNDPYLDTHEIDALVDKAFKVVNSPGEGDKKTLLETVKDLERIIEAGKGKKSECIAGIGRCLFRLGELDQAREKLEEAINMRDSGPFWRTWINLRLGCIADLQKKRSEAEAFYRKAMEVRNGSQHAKGLAERFLEKPYRGYQKDG